MTSKVTVAAQCGDSNEVVVTVKDLDAFGEPEVVVMQNQEVQDFYVYDERIVSVKEVPKK